MGTNALTRWAVAILLLLLAHHIHMVETSIAELQDAFVNHEHAFINHEHVCIQSSVVVDEPAIVDASEGFEGDGLVGIDPVYCWVTHYGPPRFTADDTTSRCITIRACLLLVDHYADLWDVEIDGFCAVHKYIVWPDSTRTNWYNRHRDAIPTLLHVEGYGNYLILDRKGINDSVGVDIYEPEQDGYMYCERGIRVWEVDTDDSKMSN